MHPFAKHSLGEGVCFKAVFRRPDNGIDRTSLYHSHDRPEGIPTIRVCKDAFDHSRTTSKHLHLFIVALLAPFDLKPDWDDARKWCSNSMWSVTSVPVTSI